MTSNLDIARQAAEDNLEVFIALIAPNRVLGSCHREVINWWERPDASTHQLLLYPRDHMKSTLIAFRVAWYITKYPTLRVLYISSTSNLAEKQLGFIKNIITSKIYRRYWPNHVEAEEGKRERWTSTEICLDHPSRKIEQIRDPTIFTAGLTTNLVGMHCDIAVLDDVVTGDNAYTQEGRSKVDSQYSLLSSIESTDSLEWVVGTRYHPKDLYNSMMTMSMDVYDEKTGAIIGEKKVYEVMEKSLEDVGDGTGEYLWPRQRRKDGKWFGFDIHIYAKKKAQYLDKSRFRAQYYNDPTDPDNRPVDYSKFQYFERDAVKRREGEWYYKGKRLNLCAAMDFAMSTRTTADFTCIVVSGIDEDNNVYVLDIVRFKTPHISEYFENLQALWNKWNFRRIIMETTAAQEAIVKALKTNYIIPHGMNLKVKEVKPDRNDGTKRERIEATLLPLYEEGMIFHYRGGNCQELEEELVTNNPAHDDVKDTFAMSVRGLVKPASRRNRLKHDANVIFHPRFGGRINA